MLMGEFIGATWNFLATNLHHFNRFKQPKVTKTPPLDIKLAWSPRGDP